MTPQALDEVQALDVVVEVDVLKPVVELGLERVGRDAVGLALDHVRDLTDDRLESDTREAAW